MKRWKRIEPIVLIKRLILWLEERIKNFIVGFQRVADLELMDPFKYLLMIVQSRVKLHSRRAPRAGSAQLEQPEESLSLEKAQTRKRQLLVNAVRSSLVWTTPAQLFLVNWVYWIIQNRNRPARCSRSTKVLIRAYMVIILSSRNISACEMKTKIAPTFVFSAMRRKKVAQACSKQMLLMLVCRFRKPIGSNLNSRLMSSRSKFLVKLARLVGIFWTFQWTVSKNLNLSLLRP